MAADVGVHTAFVERGLNLFAARQQDVAALFAPAIELGLGDTGLAFGWAGKSFGESAFVWGGINLGGSWG